MDRHFEQLPRHESGDVGLAAVPDQLLQARTQVAPGADAGAIQALYGLPAASGKPHAEKLVVVGAGELRCGLRRPEVLNSDHISYADCRAVLLQESEPAPHPRPC